MVLTPSCDPSQANLDNDVRVQFIFLYWKAQARKVRIVQRARGVKIFPWQLGVIEGHSFQGQAFLWAKNMPRPQRLIVRKSAVDWGRRTLAWWNSMRKNQVLELERSTFLRWKIMYDLDYLRNEADLMMEHYRIPELSLAFQMWKDRANTMAFLRWKAMRKPRRDFRAELLLKRSTFLPWKIMYGIDYLRNEADLMMEHYRIPGLSLAFMMWKDRANTMNIMRGYVQLLIHHGLSKKADPRYNSIFSWKFQLILLQSRAFRRSFRRLTDPLSYVNYCLSECNCGARWRPRARAVANSSCTSLNVRWYM